MGFIKMERDIEKQWLLTKISRDGIGAQDLLESAGLEQLALIQMHADYIVLAQVHICSTSSPERQSSANCSRPELRLLTPSAESMTAT